MKKKPSWIPRLFLLGGCLVAIVFLSVVVNEWDYYSEDPSLRPYHPSHELLRPSGGLGLGFGLLGTGFMVLNLTYLFRKRLARVAALGSLRSWMAFHVFTGLVGPLLILLHSSLLLRSALGALSFCAMLVVVATGLVGRFFYALFPRSIEGREMRLSEIRSALEETLERLRGLRVDPEIVDVMKMKTPALPPDSRDPGDGGAELPGFFSALPGIIRSELGLRRELRKLRRRILASEELRPQAVQVLPLARRLCRQRLWLASYHQLQRVLASWRFFHRWLAIAMLATVAFHIAIAIRYGKLWILEGP